MFISCFCDIIVSYIFVFYLHIILHFRGDY
nr:MAG TPA: hypothetical protein [Caudoviricetes sp.]DAT28227.1 MAG TPA: hypothetical protein [Bacteriophage sp.]